jgi:hypothetical protein
MRIMGDLCEYLLAHNPAENLHQLQFTQYTRALISCARDTALVNVSMTARACLARLTQSYAQHPICGFSIVSPNSVHTFGTDFYFFNFFKNFF